MAKELLDFFDEKGKFVLTAAKSTKYKENSNLYIKGVYILIINNKKEILIQRKREDHTKLNRWEIPSGHVASGESFEEAAKRELKEETGITVPLQHIKTIKIEKSKEIDAFYTGYSNLLPNANNNPEVDAFEFISFDNLIDEIKNNTRLFAPQLIKFLKDNRQDFKKKFISSSDRQESIVWKGVVLEESLEDKSLLKLAKIVGTDVNKLEKENRVMTFHKVEVEDSIVRAYLDKAMRTIKPAFYIHLCKGGEMYVVFRRKMFNFRKGDKELERARAYGKSIGIIPEQMPFEHLIDHPFD